MRFPTRDFKHVMETKSMRLLASLAPDSWIVREVTERDYGIDAYIEIASDKGEITGNLISIQMKAMESIDRWTGEGDEATARSPSIATSTAAYWFHLPVPVFLLVADLKKEEIYWVSVEPAIRKSYLKLQTQDTMSFPLSKVANLSSDAGRRFFQLFIAVERHHDEFVHHAIGLLSHLRSMGEFIAFNQQRDSFLEVESDRELEFNAIYRTLLAVAGHFLVNWDVDPMSKIYEKDRADWKDQWVRLHDGTLGYALRQLEPWLPKLARLVVELVKDQQAEFWQRRSPVLYAVCNSSDIDYLIKEIESLR